MLACMGLMWCSGYLLGRGHGAEKARAECEATHGEPTDSPPTPEGASFDADSMKRKEEKRG